MIGFKIQKRTVMGAFFVVNLPIALVHVKTPMLQ